MATRSLINVMCLDNKVRSIYVHWDGEDHLPILQEHYNTLNLAEKLISLGDLSTLDESAEDPPLWHTFENPVNGYCVAYGRDREEKNTEAKVFKNFEEARIQNRGQEFVYEFFNNSWTQFNCETGECIS